MRALAAATFALFLATAVSAQVPTATLDGRVMIGRQPAAGVLVTISSPALQGTRSTETSVEGTYIFPALPPGEYRVTFALSGLQTVIKSIDLHVTDVKHVDAELRPGISEEITVVPEAIGGTDSPQMSTTLDQETVNSLPMGRAIRDIAKLAAGVRDSGPSGALTIHGAPSTENLYLVNGAVITEGTHNQPQNLFIEDAILETTVLSGGISAEYGRFTGGVVNVLTKSGGNEFTGSLRDNVSNDRWTSRTPVASELEHLDEVNHDYEGTLGGRIIRDRLWFFTAARSARRTERRQTAGTNIPYTWESDERRFEMKATVNLGAHQTVVGSHLDIDARDENLNGFPVGELSSLYDLEYPQSLLALHYTAVLPRTVVLEGQFTRKRYDLTGGGTDTSRIGGTPLFDLDTGYTYGSPILCAVCNRNYRNNHEVALKATAFHASPRLGTHSLVAGVSDFHELASDDGHQSPSDFDVYTTTRVVNGQTYFMLEPGLTQFEWWPVFVPSAGDDFRTRSAFVNDRLDLGRHWSFNLGLRYDHSTGRDQGGGKQAEGSRWSPRLAASYDIGGDRRNHVSVSFGRYAAKIDEYVARQASPAGSASNYVWDYDGPAVNTGTTLVSMAEVLRRLFEWFDSVGGTSNTDYLVGASSPAGLTIEEKLKAPVMDEVTLGYGLQLGHGGSLRLDLIRRQWHDFYALRATTATGTVLDPVGSPVDKVIIENNDAGLKRQYHGASLQGSWQRGELRLGGNYTLSKLRGNVESDTAGSGTEAVPSPVAYYPEYTSYPAYAQEGYLAADERHRGNLWVTYRVPNRIVDVEGSLLQTYHSGRRFTASGQIDLRPYVKNPGYQFPPNFQSYPFTSRGDLQLDDITATNLGLNFSRRVAQVQLFLDTEVLNVLNEHGIERNSGLNTTVRTSRTDRNLAPFNPFTATPVECPRGVSTASVDCKGVANFQFHPQFGIPTNKNAYQLPRTFRFSAGIRF